MIVSCWNKTNRFLTSMVYGLIAINVFNIVKSTLKNESNSNHPTLIKLDFYDPTGLVHAFFKVIQVFLIGTRYYPVLSAYRTNSLFLIITSCFFCWIDFIGLYRSFIGIVLIIY